MYVHTAVGRKLGRWLPNLASFIFTTILRPASECDGSIALLEKSNIAWRPRLLEWELTLTPNTWLSKGSRNTLVFPVFLLWLLQVQHRTSSADAVPCQRPGRLLHCSGEQVIFCYVLDRISIFFQLNIWQGKATSISARPGCQNCRSLRFTAGRYHAI